jgi:hypothetical protein
VAPTLRSHKAGFNEPYSVRIAAATTIDLAMISVAG